MNRRGHLSHKIPNVKLRPAPAPSASKGKPREASPLNAMDEQIMQRAWEEAEDEEMSTAALRIAGKPWKGVVITFTGVEDKVGSLSQARKCGYIS